MSVPNQRYFTITGMPIVPPFLQLSCRDIEVAAKVLSGNSFKLYIYLCQNVNGYRLEFSPQDIVDRFGISRAGIYNAIKELEEKQYLIDGKFYKCGKPAWDAAHALKQSVADS